PGARLPCHTHPFAEAVSVLAGQAAMLVEGRRYHLEHLDMVCIPRGTPHEVVNLSSEQPAVFHIAMASHAPSRTTRLLLLVRPETLLKALWLDSAGPISFLARKFQCAAPESVHA